MKNRFFWLIFVFVLIPCLSSTSTAEKVRMVTNLGNIDIVLFDDIAPITVANFLKYINDGDYVNTLIHRSIPGFVIQGGGWTINGSSIYPVEKNPPIVNEFSHSNLRGTIAMAKLPDDPNSATADNSANLDFQNGGFTAFGQLTEQSLAVMDAIASLNVYDASEALNSSAFTNLPLLNNELRPEYLVVVSRMIVAGDLPAGDIDDNWVVDLADAVMGLGIITGIPGEGPNPASEINGDGSIGVEEVIYILQKVSELR